MIQQISDSELELMRIVWARGGTALYAHIMEDLEKAGRTWQKKGLLRTSKLGRRNQYTALATEADYQAAQAQTLLNKLYEGSAKGLVSTLIERELLSAADYEELRSFWRDGGT